MTMLPDIDEGTYRAYETTVVGEDVKRRIDMLGAETEVQARIADLSRIGSWAATAETNRFDTPEPPPPESAGPAPPEPPPVAPPVRLSTPTPTPTPTPPSSSGLGGLDPWKKDVFNQAMNAVKSAGGDLQAFATDYNTRLQKGVADERSAFGEALNAASKAGADIGTFASRFSPTPPKEPPPTLGATARSSGGGGSGGFSAPASGSPTIDEVRSYIIQAAQQRGIDPDIALRVAKSEGGFEPARRGTFATGSSWWPFQLHYGGKGYENLGNVAGMGNSFTAETGWQPGDPRAWKDATDYALNRVKTSGWGDWYGAKAQGITGMMGVDSRPSSAGPLQGAAGGGGRGGFTDVSQFGDASLTAAEANAACGPAAAVRFAQRFGRNPTLREATDLAATVGWSPNAGMAGIGSQQKLMSKLGIETRLVAGARWGEFADEAATGNPVTISTAGHYFYADDYDPKSGKFHVGSSGTDLRQGKEWMSAAEMEGVMGQVQGALFADNPTAMARSSATSDDPLSNARKAITGKFDEGTTFMSKLLNSTLDSMAASDAELEQGNRLNLAQSFAGQGNTMTPSMQPTPSDVLTDPIRNTITAPLQPDLPVRRDITQPNAPLPSRIGGGTSAVESIGEIAQAVGQGDLRRALDALQRAEPVAAAGQIAGAYGEAQAKKLKEAGEQPESLRRMLESSDVPTLEKAGRLGVALQRYTPMGGFLEASDISEELATGLERVGVEGAEQTGQYVDTPLGRIPLGKREILSQIPGLIAPGGVAGETFAPARAATRGALRGAEGAAARAATEAAEAGVRPAVREAAEEAERLLDDAVADALEEAGSPVSGRAAVPLDELPRRPITAEPEAEDLASQVGGMFTRQAAAASPQFAGELGTGTAGAFAGWQTAPENATTEERLLRAGLGFGAGFAGGAAGMRLLERAGGPRPAAAVIDTSKIADPAVRQAAEDANKILGQPRVASPSALPKEINDVINAGLVKAREIGTDRRARLQAIERHIEKQTGKTLEPEESAWLRSRVYEGHKDVALATMEEDVGKALSDVKPEVRPKLSAYMQQMDNVDKAAAVARREEKRILDIDVDPVPGSADVHSMRRRVHMLNRSLSKHKASGDVAKEQLTQRRLTRANTALARRTKKVADARADAVTERGRIAQTEAGIASDRRKFSGGARAQDPAAIRAAFIADMGAEEFAKVERAAQAVWASNMKLRHRLVEAGVLHPDLAEWFDDVFPHYTRAEMLDQMSDAAIESLPHGGRSFSVDSNGVQRLTKEGTDKARRDPLQSYVDAQFEGEALAQRNEVMRTIAKYADVKGAEGFVKRLGPDEQPPKGYVAKSYMDGEKGKQRIAVPEEMEQALNLSGDTNNLTLKIFQAMSTPLRAGATALRPAFIATNAINDGIFSVFRNAVESRNPAEFARTFGDLAKGYSAAFGFDKDLAQRARKAGASIDVGTRFTDAESVVRQLSGEHVWVRPVTNAKDIKNILGATSDVAGMVWSRPLGVLSRPIEKAPRLARFAREERLAGKQLVGKEALGAAQAARTATSDFAAGGLGTKQLNSLIPFLNAATQGTTEFNSLVGKNPARAAIAMSTIISGIVGTEIYNRSVAGDEYDDVSRHLKGSGMVVMSPFPAEGEGKRGLIYIPLRGGIGSLVPLTREILGRAFGDDPRTWEELAKQTIGSLSPIEPELGGAFNFMPPPVKTAVELATNTDLFRDQPIVPKSKETLPPQEQYDARTSQTARALSRSGLPFVNQKPPMAIDYAIRNLSPGPGEALLGAGDAIIKATGNERPEAPEKGAPGARDIPGLGNILGRFLRTAGEEQRTMDYERAERNVEASREKALKRLESDPAYQKLTPDAKEKRLRALEAELQKESRDIEGIESKPRDLGLPPKYLGVRGLERERDIDQAISVVRAWEDKTGPRPSATEKRLAARYKDRIRPSWSRAMERERKEAARVRSMARESLAR